MQTIDLNVLDLKEGDRALDLGCGEGRHLHAMYYHANCHADCHVIGLDLDIGNIEKTRAGFASFPDLDPHTGRAFGLAVGTALALPFADATFDKIICSEVLEHIPDYRGVLAEMNRVLKPRGTLAISVPRYGPERICWALSSDYRNEPGGHIRIFRTSALKRAAAAHGFQCFRRHWAHGLHSPYWWLKCALGVKRTDARLVALYHRFLVWDMMQRPRLTRILEAITAPLMGKSLVLYFSKSNTGAA